MAVFSQSISVANCTAIVGGSGACIGDISGVVKVGVAAGPKVLSADILGVFGRTKAIAERVNACAKPNDVLDLLSDFCMGREEQVIAYRKRLACKTIHFIEGNHDKTTRKQQQLFASWGVLSEVNVAKQRIVLCHYAMRVWPHHAQGAWHLYGHSHANLPDEPLSLSMDVGVDTHDFRPWHFDEVRSVMKVKTEAREARKNRIAALAELATYDQ